MYIIHHATVNMNYTHFYISIEHKQFLSIKLGVRHRVCEVIRLRM